MGSTSDDHEQHPRAETRPSASDGRAALVAHLKGKPRLRWWLIYGAVRTGTTLMLRLVTTEARLYISDWGLWPMLGLSAQHPHVRLDRARAFRDISDNIFDNAHSGRGEQLDFVVKQANFRAEELQGLEQMWGPPERRIFCFREPEGYIASALRKFPDVPVTGLQRMYVESFRVHERLGGDAFEYHANRTLEDYRAFLRPLQLPPKLSQEFNYRGTARPDCVSAEMREAYKRVMQRTPPSADHGGERSEDG